MHNNIGLYKTKRTLSLLEVVRLQRILQNYKTVWNIPTPYNQYFIKRTLLVALNTSLVFL